MVHDSVLNLIGGTPVIRLRRLLLHNDTEILVKMEAFNPARSIKDRAALFIIEQAERAGLLLPGNTIIESTSGNFGKSLALIGAVKGYRVILVIDPKAPRSVIDFCTSLGAEIEMVDTADASGGYQRNRIARVREMTEADPTLYWPDQYNNPDNPRAHSKFTATELLADVGTFDTLVAAVSTGGHISGLSAALKKELPGLTTVAVDAAGSGAFGHPPHTYQMRGLGLAWRPGNLDASVVDKVHLVADYEGIATSRMLARREGLLVGESAGAAVFGALHHGHHHPGSRIVVVAADDGANYLGESFDDGWLHSRGIAAQISAAGLEDPSRLIEAARNPTHHAEASKVEWAVTI